MILNIHRNRPTIRRTKASTRFMPAVDGLESRTVLSTAGVAMPPVHTAPGHGHTVDALSTEDLVTNIKFSITNVVKTSADHLSAVGTVTGKVLGHDFLLKGVQIPLSITSSHTTTPATHGHAARPAATTTILHLALGPVNLNLLGLNLKLDNCRGGPVTVDVTAVSGSGNLLGNLLTGVANLLNPSTPVGTALSSIPGPGTGTGPGSITGTLTTALNTLLGDLTAATPTAGVPAAGGATGGATAAATATQILNLRLNPIHLNLLGLHVDTSSICLNVTAVPGTGNLLGNLLTDVANLLNGPSPLTGLAKIV